MKTVFRVLAGIYLAYIALSVLVIIPLLNFIPPWFVRDTYQRELGTELVIYNPFTLALEVRDARLSEVDGSPFASLDRAEVDLSTASLWRRGWVLDDLAIEGIGVHLRRLEDGALNIDDLLQPPGGTTPEPPPPSEGDGELPGITIDDIVLSAHRIQVTDEMRPEPYTTHWDALRVRMSDLSTVADAGQPYHLRVYDESGGSLEWDGELSIPDSFSKGHIELSAIGLRPFWRFVKDQVDFELADGHLHAAANYELHWSPELRFTVDGGEVDIARLSLKPAEPDALPDTGIELGMIKANAIAVDSASQRVQVRDINADGLRVAGWLEGERVSLVEMFQTRFPAGEATEPQEPSPWVVELGAARVNGAEIHWRSPFTEPPALQVSPLNIGVEGIRWPAEAPVDIEVDLVVNEQARAEVAGQLHLGSGAGALTFALQQLPIPWFGPNLPDVLNATIESGHARTQGELALEDFAPQQLQLAGAVEGFAVRLYGAEDSLTSWNVLEWDGLSVDLPGRRVQLAQLHLDGYSGRVHIREDGSLNIQQVLREEAEAQAAQAQAQASDEAAQAPADPGPPWRFGAPEIYISDSEVDFMDESLPIHFRTVIGDVNGEILGLDSDPAQSLSVDIKGSVDGYAPVALAGSAAPFREQPALDLGLTFQGVDLARLTPYSGTYAGYAIDRGTLNLDVRYSLEQNRLEGDNKVVIDQLKLGDKVDSDKALDIPLQLGIALLTDASGVIDIAVPVSGDVDNPEFSLASVIWGAFGNLITKAVTAPFALLANLVGSDDDLQRINYPAGGTAADEQAHSKLRDLATALAERPQLKLVITGRLNPDTDRAKLQQQLLREALLAEGLSPEDIDGTSERWAQAISARYQALPESARGDSAPEADPEAPPPSPRIQARKVQEQLPVPAEALRALAGERAADSKRFLVNEGGLAADRAVIANTDPADPDNTFSGVELSVDT